jgi:hypothetical protein
MRIERLRGAADGAGAFWLALPTSGTANIAAAAASTERREGPDPRSTFAVTDDWPGIASLMVSLTV